MRVCERLGPQITRHKTRIRELARQMMPSIDVAMDTALRVTDMVVLEHYANPHVLAKVLRVPPGRPHRRETRRGASYAERKARRLDRRRPGGRR